MQVLTSRSSDMLSFWIDPTGVVIVGGLILLQIGLWLALRGLLQAMTAPRPSSAPAIAARVRAPGKPIVVRTVQPKPLQIAAKPTARSAVSRLGKGEELRRVSAIIDRAIERSENLTRLQGRAALQLDAAEHALAGLVADLRLVMALPAAAATNVVQFADHAKIQPLGAAKAA